MSFWPVREVLLTYLARVREQMMEDYRHAQLLWQVRMIFGGKEPKPAIPPLLRESSER